MPSMEERILISFFFSLGDFFNKGFSDGVELILEEDERVDIKFDNERDRDGRETYGVFSEGYELFGRYGRFSTGTCQESCV